MGGKTSQQSHCMLLDAPAQWAAPHRAASNLGSNTNPAAGEVGFSWRLQQGFGTGRCLLCKVFSHQLQTVNIVEYLLLLPSFPPPFFFCLMLTEVWKIKQIGYFPCTAALKKRVPWDWSCSILEFLQASDFSAAARHKPDPGAGGVLTLHGSGETRSKKQSPAWKRQENSFLWVIFQRVASQFKLLSKGIRLSLSLFHAPFQRSASLPYYIIRINQYY